MQTKNKKLISLMLAGAMLAGVAGLASGCSSKDENGVYSYRKTTLGDNLIVALYNKKVELHKASATIYQNDSYSYLTTAIQTECDSSPIYTNMYTIYPSLPDESKYDELCPICFADELNS